MDPESQGQMKNAILASIIAAVVFIYLLDPVLHFVGRWIVSASGFVASAYQDRLFSELATGTPDYGYVMLFFGSSLALGIMTGFALARLARTLAKSRVALVSQPSRFRFVILVLFVFLPTLLFLLDGHLRLRFNTSFQQHVRILAPFITDQQQKELWHDWATMHARRDYDALQGKLRSLALSHDVTLPENKLYPSP